MAGRLLFRVEHDHAARRVASLVCTAAAFISGKLAVQMHSEEAARDFSKSWFDCRQPIDGFLQVALFEVLQRLVIGAPRHQRLFVAYSKTHRVEFDGSIETRYASAAHSLGRESIRKALGCIARRE